MDVPAATALTIQPEDASAIQGKPATLQQPEAQKEMGAAPRAKDQKLKEEPHSTQTLQQVLPRWWRLCRMWFCGE